MYMYVHPCGSGLCSGVTEYTKKKHLSSVPADQPAAPAKRKVFENQVLFFYLALSLNSHMNESNKLQWKND